jgi:hypothetical protein
VKGDVLKMYAFDVAVGNYLFHLHHDDATECTKYVLRSFQEGVGLLRGRAEGETLAPLDYAELTAEQREAKLLELYPDSAGFTAEQRRQIRLVLDTATDLRHNHKAAPADRIPEESVFGGLAERLRSRHRGGPVSSDELLRLARLEYGRLAKDVLQWNIQRTIDERARAWIEPASLPEADVKLLGDVVPGLTVEKLQLSSFYALKQAFARLPEAQVEELLSRASEKYRRDLRILRDVVRAEIAQYGRIRLDPDGPSLRQRMRQACEEIRRTWARQYADFWAAVREGHYSDDAITQRVWDQVYDFLGYEYKLACDDLRTGSTRWVQGWNPYKALTNIVSAGNVLSAVQVLQVYQKGGSRNDVIAAILWEGLCNVPGVAHVLAIRDAWHGEWKGVKFVVSGAVCQALQNYARKQGISWVAPFGASVLVYVTIAKTVVEMVGYEIFEPLTNDDADFMYTGRIGPTTPPPEFTNEDEERLASLRRIVEGKREEIRAPETDVGGDRFRELLEETRGLLRSVRELEAKRKRWELHRRQAGRWEAGLLRAGLERPVEASFPPVLGPDVPLRLYFGPLEGDPGIGPIDLEAEPPTPADVDRLDTMQRRLAGLCEAGGGMDPLTRIDRICELRREIETTIERHGAGTRAALLRARMREDPELAIEVARQNVFFLLDPLVRKEMEDAGQGSEEEVPRRSLLDSARFFARKEKTVPAVVDAYLKRWFDEHHPQVRSIGLLEEARKRVARRMTADYVASRKLAEDFEAWDTHRDLTRRARMDRRREALRSLVLREALDAKLRQGRKHAAELGLLTLLRNAPETDPVIRVLGVVRQEGEEARLRLRVKVIASAVRFPGPYSVELSARGGGQGAGGAKKRLLVVTVKDRDGKLVGTERVALSITDPGVPEETPTDDPVLAPGLRAQASIQRDWRGVPGWELRIGACLTGASVGAQRLTVKVGSRTYTLWGVVERPGEAAHFGGLLPLPYGKTRVELSVPDAPPVTLDVEKPQLSFPEEDLAKAREIVARRRAIGTANDDQALRLMNALGGVAWQLSLRERYAEAIPIQKEGLTVVAGLSSDEIDKARGLSLDHLQRLAFYAGDAGVMMEALNQRVDGLRRAGKPDLAERQLREGLHRFLVLGGDAGGARAIWSRIQDLARERGRTGPIPEPHPPWGTDR